MYQYRMSVSEVQLATLFLQGPWIQCRVNRPELEGDLPSISCTVLNGSVISPPYVKIWRLIKHRNNFTVPTLPKIFSLSVKVSLLTVCFVNSNAIYQQEQLAVMFTIHCFCHCLTIDLMQSDRCTSIGCRNETYFTNCSLDVSRTNSSLTVTAGANGDTVFYFSHISTCYTSQRQVGTFLWKDELCVFSLEYGNDVTKIKTSLEMRSTSVYCVKSTVLVYKEKYL